MVKVGFFGINFLVPIDLDTFPEGIITPKRPFPGRDPKGFTEKTSYGLLK